MASPPPQRERNVSVRGSIVASQIFITQAQRLIGLHLSALASTLDTAAAAGHHVTQHHRLGDAAINAAYHSHRHAAVLQATFTTFTSLSIANESPGMLLLGHRGDGTAVLARRPPGSATLTSTLATFRTLSGLVTSRTATSSNATPPQPHVSPVLGLGSTDKGGALVSSFLSK